jgi:hypothetical protein
MPQPRGPVTAPSDAIAAIAVIAGNRSGPRRFADRGCSTSHVYRRTGDRLIFALMDTAAAIGVAITSRAKRANPRAR